MKKHIAACCALLSYSLLATTYTSISKGEWDDPNNWSPNGVPCSNSVDDVIINVHEIDLSNITVTCNTVRVVQPTITNKKSHLHISNGASLTVIGGTADVEDDPVNYSSNGAALTIEGYAPGPIPNGLKQAQMHILNGSVSVETSDLDIIGQVTVQQKGELYIQEGDLNLLGDSAIFKTFNKECGEVVVGDDVHLYCLASMTGNNNNPIVLGAIGSTSTGLNPNEIEFIKNFSYLVPNNVSINDLVYNLNFVQNSCSSLPVELTFFNASNLDNKAAKLTWQTASEQNSKGFHVEHSTDGFNFKDILFVPSQNNGNSTEVLDYEFTHEKASYGINYYRLKQVDYDGKYSLTSIQAVTITGTRELNVFPTQTSKTVNVKLGEESNYILRIVDLSGRVLSEQKYSGESTELINMSNYTSGMYYFVIMGLDSREVSSFKVIKNNSY